MSPKADLLIPVTDRDHAEGSPNAAVTLVEYGDYECPYCGAAYPLIKAAQESLGSDLRLVFRNFPLTQMHPHARLAAEAAEAAAAQGKFWEMHDALYETQSLLGADHVSNLAARLGLNLDLFRAALAQHRYWPRVHGDFLGGVRSGVAGTPGFFVNGTRFEGDWTGTGLVDALFEARDALAA